MKNENRQIWEALVMILQFGISMMVPIVMCTLLGVWLGNKFDIQWIVIPLFFVGALAGGTSIYKIVKKDMDHAEKNQ